MIIGRLNLPDDIEATIDHNKIWRCKDAFTQKILRESFHPGDFAYPGDPVYYALSAAVSYFGGSFSVENTDNSNPPSTVKE